MSRCPNCGHHLNETPNYLDQVGPTDAMRRALVIQNFAPEQLPPKSEIKGEKWYVNGREFIRVLGITFCSVQGDQEIPSGFREFKTKATTIPILSGLKPSSFESRHAIKNGTKKDMARLCALWSDDHWIKYEVL